MLVTLPATREVTERGLVVASESERAFDFGDRHKFFGSGGTSGGGAHAAARLVTVEIGGVADALRDLPIDSVGEYPFDVALRKPRSGEMMRARVMWTVALDAGRKVIRLRSAVAVANSTGLDLEVFVCSSAPDAEPGDGTSIGIVRGGGNIAVPLAFSDTRSVRLRPAGPYEFSAPVHVAAAAAEAHTDVACGPAGARTMVRPVHLHASLERASEITIVRVVPPVVLQNLLPVEVMYRLSAGGAELHAGSLGVGESTMLHGADSGVTAHIALRLPGQRWSAPVRVIHKRSCASGSVRTPCSSGDVELSVACVRAAHGSISMIVSCSHWLIDQGGLGLTCVSTRARPCVCVCVLYARVVCVYVYMCVCAMCSWLRA
jgi:hypothetical protein